MTRWNREWFETERVAPVSPNVGLGRLAIHSPRGNERIRLAKSVGSISSWAIARANSRSTLIFPMSELPMLFKAFR